MQPTTFLRAPSSLFTYTAPLGDHEQQNQFDRFPSLLQISSFLVLCGSQCFCSGSSNSLDSLKPASNCEMTCTGDATQTCGGRDAISVYEQHSSLTSSPTPGTAAAQNMSNGAVRRGGVGFGFAIVSCAMAMLAMGRGRTC